jgi:hypothetical protein
MAYQPAAYGISESVKSVTKTVAAYVAKRHGEAGKRHRKQ